MECASLAKQCVRVAGIAVCLFFIATVRVDAALLYLDPSEADLHRGDTATVAVRIDTDTDECINTVDVIIKYDAAVRAEDVSRGDSILNIWVEDPVIDEANHTITFAGGIPGGYCGRIAGDPSLTNVLAEIVFRSPGFAVGAGTNPVGTVWIDEASQVFLHDGIGTRAELRTEGATFTLLSTAGTAIDDSWKNRVNEDETPPADFAITLAQDETAFSGEYFITFNSQDKQSGIDHYEVIEEPIEDLYSFTWGGVAAPWSIAESPYVLKDQTLNSTIRVKAVDKAGNETMVIFVPDTALRSMSLDRLITISVMIGGALIVLVGVGYVIWRRKKSLIAAYENNSHE